MDTHPTFISTTLNLNVIILLGKLLNSANVQFREKNANDVALTCKKKSANSDPFFPHANLLFNKK
jgi:hypothetical protein